MRDTTERPEALDAGTVKLVGTDYNRIVNEVSVLIDDKVAYENEQGSEPLWRRACLWTYCERIAVQNIKDVRLNLKIRLLIFLR